MDVEAILQAGSISASALTFSAGAVAAAFNWLEKARDQRRTRVERRREEIERLLAAYEKYDDTFCDIFDYQSDLDDHIRIDRLAFNAAEVATRTSVDEAFDHLRQVHWSVRSGLIEHEDLGPWVYWIHRVDTREPLARYARACGYGAFLDDLRRWTARSSEIRELVRHCPWWRSTARQSAPTT